LIHFKPLVPGEEVAMTAKVWCHPPRNQDVSEQFAGSAGSEALIGQRKRREREKK